MVLSVQNKLSVRRVLLCGGLIVTLSVGIRHGFGLWLLPISQAHGWDREVFSFAMAVQNLVWGLVGIFAGMLADRYGAFRVMVGGALCYALGLFGMAYSTTPLMFILTAGVISGMAQAATTYVIVFGIIGRHISASKRSWAMGVAAATGSFGQFMMLPISNSLISLNGWQGALVILACLSLLIIPLASFLRERVIYLPATNDGAVVAEQGVMEALWEALSYRSYVLLIAGYFVCGFQVVFIAVHLPGYLKDNGLGPEVASFALALIGLFNIFGSYLVGVLGQRFQKRYLLMAIYALRIVIIAIFLLAPLSSVSVYLFSMALGLLWLSTVPPTNALIAIMFGVRHLSMLGGLAFFSHQVGSFLGVWLGGIFYDRFGNYDLMWTLAIVLSVFATLANWPIQERAIARQQGAA
ncbi:MFS transporter [Oligella urethralis]|uniref:MFS transporter n=2 Tax=Oligella urethralis TaxID=90245 RepID=A0A095Z6T1_9BURK|nr:MFS transporter [Oligella urethralis]KGF30363.1 MFS transporter [Oligella urethralis DNF00040]MDK6201861.1 MFS transporter [Oligella urethralis]SPY06972.1 Inner membrane protein yhjX [Oligella urethralis]SUA65721.1 Inner membrane protein yhjX [Oligella urethralis]